jgi:hypothetical protein
LDESQAIVREQGIPPHLATGQILSAQPYMAG